MARPASPAPWDASLIVGFITLAISTTSEWQAATYLHSLVHENHSERVHHMLLLLRWRRFCMKRNDASEPLTEGAKLLQHCIEKRQYALLAFDRLLGSRSTSIEHEKVHHRSTR